MEENEKLKSQSQDGDKKGKKRKKKQTIEAGTTATTVLVTKDRIICANAGDSRTVISKMGGEPFALSVDHKPSDELETQRIVAAGGWVDSGRIMGRLAVSRALGDFEFKGNEKYTEDKQMVSPEPEFFECDR